MSGNAVVLAHREKHEILDRQDIFQASLCPTVTFSQFIEAATEDAQPGRVFCLAQNTERRKGCLGLQKQSQHAPQGLSRMRLGVKSVAPCGIEPQPSEPESEILSIKL